MAKKIEQSNEILYFTEPELRVQFHAWWVEHGAEQPDQRIGSFVREFKDDPLVHDSIGAATDGTLGGLLDHVRLLCEQEAERERVKSDLMYLCREYLGYRDLNDDLHGRGVRELEQAIAAGHRDIMILWPRGHLKTSLFSIGRTIQRILQNPDCRKAILSYGYSKAMEILAEIKSHLQNPKLVALFPEIVWENPKRDAPFWREDRITVNRTRTVSGFTLKVSGIEQGYTGEHNDEMVFDDPHDIENTENLERINKVIERFKNCHSVLDPDGYRIVVGTIWANEDLYHWCKENDFYVIRRTATENSKGRECDLSDPDAHPVYPEKFSLGVLQKKRNQDGRSFYAKQYNLMPLADEDIKFKEELLRYYEEDPEYQRVYILVDPALSREKQHDSTAAEFVGLPKDSKLPLHVIKSVELRKKTQGVINFIFDEYAYFSKVCPDVFVGVEQAALQYILIEWLRKEMQERKVFFEVHELKHGSRPKTERIAKLEPLFDNQGIILHKQRCEKLKQQLINYGASKHDDHVDALAYLPGVLESKATVQVIEPYVRREDPYSMEAILEQMEGAGTNWRDY